MIDEKIYTQEDLNNAITKAILEMTGVLKRKDDELIVYKKALELACASLEKMCDTTRHCDEVNCPIYDDCVNSDNWEEYYLRKAREENAT